MGRLLFLGAVAFVAFRYISKSNQRHLGPPERPRAPLLPPVSGPQIDVVAETTSVRQAESESSYAGPRT